MCKRDVMEFLVRHSWGTSGVALGYTALRKVHSGCRVEGKMEEIRVSSERPGRRGRLGWTK